MKTAGPRPGPIAFLCLTLPFLLLSGCVAPPASPAEKAARHAAAAEYAARNCGFMVGGFGDVRQMKKVANEEIVKARSLGATDALLAKARNDVAMTVATGAAFTTQRDACGQLVSSLAWSTS